MSNGFEGTRAGARGGRDQFQWDDVQQMSYKDREQYLGFSTKIGYLDKGGQWRKKDWWTGVEKEGDKEAQLRQEQLRSEKLEAKRQDEAILNFKLMEKGLPCTDAKYESLLEGCTDIASVIQKVRQGDNVQMKGKENLQSHEFKQLIQKDIDNNREGGELDEAHLADKIQGLGHAKRHHIASGAYSGLLDEATQKDVAIKTLTSEALPEAAAPDKHQEIMLNFIMDKMRAEKEKKREEKKKLKEMKKETERRDRSKERRRVRRSKERRRPDSRSPERHRERDREQDHHRYRRRDDKEQRRRRSRSRDRDDKHKKKD